MHNQPHIVDIIYFHGITLTVIADDGVKYIPAKPLSDLVESNWRTARRTLNEGDNAVLYASHRIKVCDFAAEGGLKASPEDTLCIRLDRAYLYLARINTSRMRANGNVEAAERLLNLQIEWAKVLHDYETKGIALKEKQKANTGELMQLMKMRQMAIKEEKAVFTQLLHQRMKEMGLSITSAQSELFS